MFLLHLNRRSVSNQPMRNINTFVLAQWYDLNSIESTNEEYKLQLTNLSSSSCWVSNQPMRNINEYRRLIAARINDGIESTNEEYKR